MKNIAFIMITAILCTGCAKDIHRNTKTASVKKTKTSGSLLFGAYTWGDSISTKGKIEISDVQVKPIDINKKTLDTTKYEVKSIMGGAVKWTSKKKNKTVNQ